MNSIYTLDLYQMRTRGGGRGQKKSKNFADVICTCPKGELLLHPPSREVEGSGHFQDRTLGRGLQRHEGPKEDPPSRQPGW